MNNKKIVKRVVVVGLPKAGTSSIDFSLSSAGYVTCHQRYRNNIIGHSIQQCVNLGLPPFSRIEKLILDDIKDEQIKVAYTQMDFCLRTGANVWPQLDYLEDICKFYPEAFYILNYRDAQAHISSIDGWFDLRKKLTNHNIKGLPSGKGSKDVELLDWIEYTHKETSSLFLNKFYNFLSLKIDEPDAGNRLSDFLQEEIVWTHKNKSKVKTRK
jgi:hypothetical protein